MINIPMNQKRGLTVQMIVRSLTGNNGISNQAGRNSLEVRFLADPSIFSNNIL